MFGRGPRVDHLLGHAIWLPLAALVLLEAPSASAVEVRHSRLLDALAVERGFRKLWIALPNPIRDTAIEVVGNLIDDIEVVSLFACDQINIAATLFVSRHGAEMLKAAARSVEG